MTMAGTIIGVPAASSRSSRSTILGLRSLSAKITTLVSRQYIRSVERNLVVARAGPPVVRQPLGQERFRAGGDQLRAPRLNVELRLFKRLQDDLVAEFAHPHFFAGQAKFLWQTDRLAPPVHEDLGCRNHPKPQI